MNRKVYRSLDKPTAFFGIRGRYTTWLAMMIGVVIVLALFVAQLTVGFIGWVTLGIGAVASYLFIIGYQERVSDRELDKIMDSKRLKSCIRRTPGPIRQIWKEQ